MDPALKRRLDALLVLQATTIGVAVTVLVAAEMVGPLFLAFALAPTAAILLVAYVYIDRGADRTMAHEEAPD